jgi:hypothetical protein
MSKKNKASLKSLILLSLASTAFVVAIAFASFDNQTTVAIAGGITFAAVFLVLLVLRALTNDDEFKPGEPRLK